MTAARRSASAWSAYALLGLALVLSFILTSLVSAATTERIVLDRRTGLAIHGYDPVAYFTDAVALAGRAELELSYGGVVWRFRNAGNRAAFAERPDVYMPQFGGYDPPPTLVDRQQPAVHVPQHRSPRCLRGGSPPYGGGRIGEMADRAAQPRPVSRISTGNAQLPRHRPRR